MVFWAEPSSGHGTPAILHSDYGAQYLAWRHTQRLAFLGAQISMADTGLWDLPESIKPVSV